jgi:hypothetical protein
MNMNEAVENHPNMLTVDGHDNAIIGIAYRFTDEPLLAYDIDIIMMNLMNDGMTYEEAMEFYEFNIAGAYMGEFTPIFIERFE